MRHSSEGTLEAVGLCKAYPAAKGGRPVQALQDVSLEVPSGGFVSIVGPSGCGKSTLLHLLSGLEKADEGCIKVDGVEANALSRSVALMPQDDLLLPWRSILDNVILGPVCEGRNVKRARLRAQELFPVFGLEGFEQAYPADLSGGMRQRAALLRTFFCERSFHLLDEPFGRLDALTRASMQQWLTGYWEQRRSAVILVTHSIDEALFMADQVYVMSPRPGRILARLEIPFARPRHYVEVVTSPEFGALKRDVFEHLEREHWSES